MPLDSYNPGIVNDNFERPEAKVADGSKDRLQ
jgi:hypothetical protein